MNSNSIFGNGKTHVTLAIMAAMGLGLAAQTTHADEAAPQRVVRFADLDTNTPAGAQAQDRRIHFAAAGVCERANAGDLHVAAIAQACKKQAIRTAVIAVNNPLVTREYLAANHLTPTTISVASLP
jgi:UrcA family protein